MKPLNNHVMIQPIEVEDFVRTAGGMYQEIGTVLEVADGIDLPIGTEVYFDSWLAKKYPVKGSTDKYIWFVDYKDIVAYEVPKLTV
jgi:hypothetical protein